MQTKAELFEGDLVHLAEQAKALSHPARLAILKILAAHNTCICGEIVDDLPLAQATVSRHLKVLKEAGLVQGEVEGPRVCYCLDKEAVTELQEHFGTFMDDILNAPAEKVCC